MLRPSPDRLDAQIRSLSHGQDQCLKIIMDEMKDNRTTIQKLQERVTLLESKLQDVQKQVKQSKNALLAAAAAAQATLAPSAAIASVPVPRPALVTPSVMKYPPSAYRAEGFDYWTTHGYDPAAALHGYLGFQPPVPPSNGVGYAGMAPRGTPPPPHYPSRNLRPESEYYGSGSFASGDEYRRETDFRVQTPKFFFGDAFSSSTLFSSSTVRPPSSTLAVGVSASSSLHLANKVFPTSHGNGATVGTTSVVSGIATVTVTSSITASGFGSRYSAAKVNTFRSQPLQVESVISTTSIAISNTKPSLFGSSTDGTLSITKPSLFKSSTGGTHSNTKPSLFGSATDGTSYNITQLLLGQAVSASTPIFSSTKVTGSSTQPPFESTQFGAVVGGFTFSNSPVIKVEEKKDVAEEKKGASKPANPFANFSFTPGTKSAATKDDNKEKSEKQEVTFGGIPKTQQTGFSKWLASGQDTLNQILSDSSSAEVNENNPVSTAASSVFGSTTSAFGLSFKAVAESSASGFASKKVDADIFSNKGQRLFEERRNSEKDNETGNDEGEEEYVPNRSFEALVSLPEVEVVTGEENETKLFGARAKLYRMDNESKQWKERGVGEIKILQHAVNQKFRILMRREQVLKVCANHSITTKMKLLPMKTSDTSWCWFAGDFSDGEIHEEQLCVKFKTTEAADNFKQCFEDCQKMLAESDAKQDGTSGPKRGSAYVDLTTKISASEERSSEASASLSSLFKPKDGEWQCEECYVKNGSDKARCAVCETPKPGLKVEALHAPLKTENIDYVSSSLSSLFKPAVKEWQCDACYVKNDASKLRCVTCDAPKSGAPGEQRKDAQSSVQLKFGPNVGFTVGAAKPISLAAIFRSSVPTTYTGKKEDGVGFVPKASGFGQVSTGFGWCAFGNTKDTETKTGSDYFDSSISVAASGTSQPVSDAVKPFSFVHGSQGFGASFAGIRSFRCKVRQPASGAGKENARPISLTPTSSGSKSVFSFGGAGGSASPASFVFGGKGFSRGLSNAGTAADDAPQTTENPTSESTPKNSDSSTSALGPKPAFEIDAECAVVRVEEPSAQLVEKAQQFQLSRYFYNFLNAAPCPGCVGCDPDSFDFSTIGQRPKRMDTADPNFKWEGAGTQLFGAKEGKSNRQNEDVDEDGSGAEDQEEENFGIHFNPIVQLPEVEVKTGEEDEDELFRERAKLYRFDNGQWKERGVGDMKILKSRVNGSHRLLLRREQVHKVACNHLLTTEMKLQPQRMTENAWCWFAQDFAEGEARMEQFALRFKTPELAKKFKDKFVECQNEIGRTTLKGQSSGASASSPAPEARQTGPSADRTQGKPSPALSTSGRSSYREAASNVEVVDEDSTSATSKDEDDEEIALIFSKRATAKYKTNNNVFHEGGMVEIMALEDDDVAGIRLQMHRDSDETICNHIICTGYEIKRSDERYSCEWTAKDFSTDEPIRKTFQVTFSSMPALQEFERIFQNGVQMAVQSELSETKADEFYHRPSEDDDSNDEDYGH